MRKVAQESVSTCPSLLVCNDWRCPALEQECVFLAIIAGKHSQSPSTTDPFVEALFC